MTYEAIGYEVADHVATITLNRPDVHNAMNNTMRRELTEVFTRLATDDAVRVVLVTGAGDRAFSAGAPAPRRPAAPSATIGRGVVPAGVREKRENRRCASKAASHAREPTRLQLSGFSPQPGRAAASCAIEQEAAARSGCEL